MTHFETLKEAKAYARTIGGTYRKVCGGWLVMSWADFWIWKNQR